MIQGHVAVDRRTRFRSGEPGNKTNLAPNDAWGPFTCDQEVWPSQRANYRQVSLWLTRVLSGARRTRWRKTGIFLPPRIRSWRNSKQKLFISWRFCEISYFEISSLPGSRRRFLKCCAESIWESSSSRVPSTKPFTAVSTASHWRLSFFPPDLFSDAAKDWRRDLCLFTEGVWPRSSRRAHTERWKLYCSLGDWEK